MRSGKVIGGEVRSFVRSISSGLVPGPVDQEVVEAADDEADVIANPDLNLLRCQEVTIQKSWVAFAPGANLSIVAGGLFWLGGAPGVGAQKRKS